MVIHSVEQIAVSMQFLRNVFIVILLLFNYRLDLICLHILRDF